MTYDLQVQEHLDILSRTAVDRFGGATDSDSDPEVLFEETSDARRAEYRPASRRDVKKLQARMGDFEQGLRDLNSKIDMLLTHQIRSGGH